MPIVAVSRWNIDPQTAQQIMREAAPLLRQQGATRITLGRIHTGNNTGQTTVTVQYNDWESYGQALETQKSDQNYQKLYEKALSGGQTQQGQQGQRMTTLQDRTIISIEEIQ